jgi:hypothetical protein
MTERFYELAGIRYRFLVPKDCLWDTVWSLQGYIAQPGDWDIECVISIPEELSAPEGEHCYGSYSLQVFQTHDAEICYHGSAYSTLEGAYLRICRQGTQCQVELKASAIPKGITDNVVLTCLQAVHRITEAGGILLHASWIRYGDRAILFTGPSGIGKSTQADLWVRHRGAELINGDRAAVFPVTGGAQVRGIPYCGSSGVNKNRTIPLAAVVCLSQSSENRLTRLNGLQAFRQLWEGCSVNLWSQEDIGKATQAVVDIVSVVPVFRLECTADEEAVTILEKEGLT